jgi:hypothetical protein
VPQRSVPSAQHHRQIGYHSRRASNAHASSRKPSYQTKKSTLRTANTADRMSKRQHNPGRHWRHDMCRSTAAHLCTKSNLERMPANEVSSLARCQRMCSDILLPTVADDPSTSLESSHKELVALFNCLRALPASCIGLGGLLSQHARRGWEAWRTNAERAAWRLYVAHVCTICNSLTSCRARDLFT